jgi:hypothetical protein
MTALGTNIEGILESLRDERSQLEHRLAVLKEREATLVQWLVEETPHQQTPQLPIMARPIEAAPLSSYLYSVLSDGKPRTVDKLAELASQRQLVNGDAKRRVHLALVGLKRRNYIKREQDGTWMTIP